MRREEELALKGTLAPLRRAAITFLGAGAIAALLAGCSGQTTFDQATSLGKYQISFASDPAVFNPPQQVTMSYALTDSTNGKAVSAYDTVYGALMHTLSSAAT